MYQLAYLQLQAVIIQQRDQLATLLYQINRLLSFHYIRVSVYLTRKLQSKIQPMVSILQPFPHLVAGLLQVLNKMMKSVTVVILHEEALMFMFRFSSPC